MGQADNIVRDLGTILVLGTFHSGESCGHWTRRYFITCEHVRLWPKRSVVQQWNDNYRGQLPLVAMVKRWTENCT